MKKILALVLTSFIMVPMVFGQELYTPYKFKDRTNPFDIDYEYDRFAEEELGLFQRIDSKIFEEVAIYGKDELFYSGYIYYDWPEVSDYLNSVLGRIKPADDWTPDIFLNRDPSLNAFTIYDGTIFMNAGLLAELPNEASLAILLGHEWSHFLNWDNQYGFPESLKGGKRKQVEGLDPTKRNLAVAHQNREEEKRCDLDGMKWSEEAGYDIQYGDDLFALLQDYSDSTKTASMVDLKLKNNEPLRLKDINKMSEDELRKALASHPETEARIEYLNAYSKSSDRRLNKKTALVDADKFTQIQNMARCETMHNLLIEAAYEDCVFRAFRFHIQDPSNPNYVYYLAESLRRLMYAYPSDANTGFITGKYKFGEEKKLGVLNNLAVLRVDSTRIDWEYADNFYNEDGVKFQTNMEAFEYFTDLGLERGITETYLTAGLSDIEKYPQGEYLLNYLARSNAKYKDYARGVLENTLTDWVRDDLSHVVVWVGENYHYNHQYYGPHKMYIESFDETLDTRDLIIELEEGDDLDVNIKFVSDLKVDDLDTYYAMMSTFNIISVNEPVEAPIVEEDEDEVEEDGDEYYEEEVEEEEEDEKEDPNHKTYKTADIFKLAPESWYFFKEQGMTELVYLFFFEYRAVYQVRAETSFSGNTYEGQMESYYIQKKFNCDKFERRLDVEGHVGVLNDRYIEDNFFNLLDELEEKHP